MEENNKLEMGMFGLGGEQELDLNFEDKIVPEDNKEIEEGKDKNLNPSDGANPQEDVAKEGGIKKGDDDGTSSPNIYHDLANVFKEQGLLSTAIKDIKDIDSFTSAFKEEIKQSEFADLSDFQKEYLEASRSGIPTEMFDAKKKDETNLNNISPEDIEKDVELRKVIIYQDLVNQGLSDENALKYMKISVENEKDIEDAEAALPNIKKFNNLKYEKEVNKLKEEAKTKKETADKEKQALKDAIMSPKKDIFEDFPVTDNLKDSVYKGMNSIVGYDKAGNPENELMKFRRENPVDFNTKLYYLFSLTNGFNNLKRFEQSGTSSAVSNLEKTLMSSNFAPSSGQPSFIEDPESYSSGFGDEIVL